MEYNCGCAICKNHKPFEMPDKIVEATLNEDLVIFAGAGVSTENKTVFPTTLYVEICEELGIDYNHSFSKVMSLYCEKASKRKLLQKIKKRLDYVYSFNGLYNFASRFHRELSTIYLIKSIFTTNWDDLFEKECGALPIVTSEDFALWDLPGRKVFKLHGSINNIGTIVATEEDYEECYERLNNELIGNYLRMALATKTVVFIGYSFGDEDFNRIYNFLKREMNDLLPEAYLVTLDEKAEEKFEDKNINPIITDGTYFIHKLKNELIQREVLLEDEVFEAAEYLLMKVNEAHNKVSENHNALDSPQIIYTLSYQDGLIHALQRIKNRKDTGEYSHHCHVINVAKRYEEIRDERLKLGHYEDVAYIEGYINGLTFLLLEPDERQYIPLFFIYGGEKSESDSPLNYEEFEDLINSNKVFNKETYEHAQKIVEKMGLNDNIDFYHSPIL